MNTGDTTRGRWFILGVICQGFTELFDLGPEMSRGFQVYQGKTENQTRQKRIASLAKTQMWCGWETEDNLVWVEFMH